jgi:cytochrome c553
MKYLVYSALLINMLLANTTMCYKNNIKDISTVEDKKFDGGKCNSTYSITDMKKNKWTIDDIKISKNDKNLFNFIYILKNNETKKVVSPNKIDYSKLSKVMETNKKIETQKDSLKNGEKVYNMHCKSCHGTKGEKTPGSSLALNTMSLDDLQYTMRAYRQNEQDKGLAIIMKPYADLIMATEVKEIFEYLKQLNK